MPSSQTFLRICVVGGQGLLHPDRGRRVRWYLRIEMGPRTREDVDDGIATLAQTKYVPSPMPEAVFTLVVTEGPDVGQTLLLDGSQPSRVLLGQSPACELRLSDPLVSRRHVALEIVGHRLHLTDLGSTNGTLVDRLSVMDASLEGSETIRVGSTTIRVELGPAPPPGNLSTATSFGRVIGWSREMRRLYPLAARLAAADVPIIIEGETGTGKEVLAEALHEQGGRAAEAFVVFDCTAVPGNLVESELFGHERGAFTGAVAARKGVFEQAHGGTLLIDEIGDLDLTLQPKLLRAIERSEIRRVGGDKWTRVDVRVLAATRRDLDREVQAGRFRDDLFHRLAVGRIELPPLRQRRGDVPLLARHFAEQMGKTERDLPSGLLSSWEDYAWPGNVRELRNAVARYLALGEFAHLEQVREEVAEPGDAIARVLTQRLPLIQARQCVVDEFERRYVKQVLGEHGGNVAKAAAASGIGRRYFDVIRSRTK
jgi:two-component system response regulator HydG